MVLTLIPCLLCHQDLSAVPSKHEEHLKKVHKVKFQIEWIIKKTWKERIRKISSEKEKSDHNAKKKQHSFGNVLNDSDEDKNLDYGECDSVIETMEDSLNELKEELNDESDLVTDESDLVTDESDLVTDESDLVTDESDLVTDELSDENNSIINDPLDDSKTEVKTEFTKDRKSTNNNGKKQFSCEHCGEQFSGKMYLKRHKTTVHEDMNKIKDQFTCDKCGKQYTRAINLKDHKAAVHEGNAYRCEECNISLTNAVSLKRHKDSVHEGIRFTCDKCAASFVQMKSLKVHKASVHDGIRYMCDQCSVSPFNNERGLKRHQESVHAGNVFQCSLCDFKTEQRVILNKHISVIHNL